jgi:putative transposase
MGGSDALEGVFGHGRKNAVCGSPASRRGDGGTLQGIWDFPQDRLQDLRNNERPHEALDMKCPAEVYQPSPRPYTGLPDLDYPLHDKTIVVTRCGRICLGKKKINFSHVFAGQAVGIKEVHDDIWLVSFMDYDLAYFDLETRVLEPLENPFGPKVLPMS